MPYLAEGVAKSGRATGKFRTIVLFKRCPLAYAPWIHEAPTYNMATGSPSPLPLPKPERFKSEQEETEETESLQRAGAWLNKTDRGSLFGWSPRRKKSPASGLCTFLCSLRCLMFNSIVPAKGEGESRPARELACRDSARASSVRPLPSGKGRGEGKRSAKSKRCTIQRAQSSGIGILPLFFSRRLPHSD